jgi:hypothetical protein
MVRLAWHDAGTFDKNVKGEWPKSGGAIGMCLLVNQSIINQSNEHGIFVFLEAKVYQKKNDSIGMNLP